jgi:hypothetical protein
MPLTAYLRGATWWAKGRVDYNGRPVSGYIRESTGASDPRGAGDWIAQREERERRRFLLGEEERPLTFADAVELYRPTPSMAKYLIPILAELGELRLDRITPGMVRALGPKLYPGNCTDSWRRWVITPARAVINNANDLGQGPPIRIKGYSEQVRVDQDKSRRKPSRIERMPGSWEWLLRFRAQAPRYHAALALFMFATGARIGQAVAMHPRKHLDLQNARVCIPGAKGHADRWITVPMELVVELANLPAKTPRGWERKPANLRVFGFASRCGPLKAWKKACERAGLPYLPPHSSGRHGFGQEMSIRQDIDDKAVGKFGGWSDVALLKRTYTHAEDAEGKIHAGFKAGLEQAEAETGLRLLGGRG